MANPLQFAQPNINPQVISGGGAPDPYDQLLQAILGGAQMGQQGQRTAVAKQEQDRLAAADAAELATRRATGKALREGIQTEAYGEPLKDMGGGMMGRRVRDTASGVLYTDFGAPKPKDATSPMAILAGVVNSAPDEAVSDIVQQWDRAFDGQQEHVQRQQRQAAVEQSIAQATPELQPILRSLNVFVEGGLNMSKELQKQFFPALVPLIEKNDPARVGQWAGLIKIGVSAGEAAKIAGISLEGLNPNAALTPPARPGSGGTDTSARDIRTRTRQYDAKVNTQKRAFLRRFNAAADPDLDVGVVSPEQKLIQDEYYAAREGLMAEYEDVAPPWQPSQGGLPPLTAAQTARARTDPEYRQFLTEKGYSLQ